MGHFQHVVWLAVILAAAAVLPDTPERGSPANQLDPKEQRKSSIVLNTKQGKSLQSVLCVWKGGLSISVGSFNHHCYGNKQEIELYSL